MAGAGGDAESSAGAAGSPNDVMDGWVDGRGDGIIGDIDGAINGEADGVGSGIPGDIDGGSADGTEAGLTGSLPGIPVGGAIGTSGPGTELGSEGGIAIGSGAAGGILL